MGKLQPNFSWQKYEGKPEDQKEQFQYQLQSQHILVANSINATINDLSYYTQERQTSFLWINNTPIFTQTFAIQSWTAAGTSNVINMNIGGYKNGFQVINMFCCLSNGTSESSVTKSLPFIDLATPANNVSIVRNGQSIQINTGGTDYSSFSGYVTVYYIKN
jgi:hypothetical protein